MKITPPYLLASGIGQNDKQTVNIIVRHGYDYLLLIQYKGIRNHPRQLYWNLAKIWSCFFRTFSVYHLFLMSKKWHDIFRIILKWFYFIAPMTPFWSHDVFVFFLSTNNAVLFNSASSFNNGMTLALLGRRPIVGKRTNHRHNPLADRHGRVGVRRQ